MSLQPLEESDLQLCLQVRLALSDLVDRFQSRANLALLCAQPRPPALCCSLLWAKMGLVGPTRCTLWKERGGCRHLGSLILLPAAFPYVISSASEKSFLVGLGRSHCCHCRAMEKSPHDVPKAPQSVSLSETNAALLHSSSSLHAASGGRQLLKRLCI